MEVPSYYDPMRNWRVWIPRDVDGSGVVALNMRAGNMKHFGLDKFPSPEDHGVPLPGGEGKAFPFPSKRGGANQGNFRLAYKWTTEMQKPHMCRFRLGSGWKIETLAVITNYLRENYEGPFEIRNEFGNNVWGSCFSNAS